MKNLVITSLGRLNFSLFITILLFRFVTQAMFASTPLWYKQKAYESAYRVAYIKLHHTGRIVQQGRNKYTNTVNDEVWLVVERDSGRVRMDKYPVEKDAKSTFIVLGDQKGIIFKTENKTYRKEDVSYDFTLCFLLGRASRLLTWPTNVVYEQIGTEKVFVHDQKPLAILHLNNSEQSLSSVDIVANDISTKAHVTFEDYIYRRGLRFPKNWSYTWSNSEVEAEGEVEVKTFYLRARSNTFIFELEGLRKSARESLASSINEDALYRTPEKSLSDRGADELAKAWHLLQSDINRIEEQYKSNPIELEKAQENLMRDWRQRVNELFAKYGLNAESNSLND